MILRSENIKQICNMILQAVDNSTSSTLTETLELKTLGDQLFINVTNREYYVRSKLDMGSNIEFHATVNANLFLKLIAQITTDTIEFSIKDNALIIKGNGNYKLPLIYNGDNLLELPEITIDNVTNEFNIDSEILKSILQYNSREINKEAVAQPVQRLYYMDEQGAITFTSGACVNSFTLEQPVKLLLNNKIVKLFKLFKEGNVKFTLGYDPISDEIIQTKVKFATDTIELTAILSCDDSNMSRVPVKAIRGRANNDYPYSINVSKDTFIQTLNRLLLFSTPTDTKEIIKPHGTFEFYKDSVVVYDTHKNNKETILYNNSVANIEDKYVAILDLADLKTKLESCNEPYLTINFGDDQAIVIARGNIKNVIPQCRG